MVFLWEKTALILSSLKRLFGAAPPPLDGRLAFETFEDRQAAYLAQKTAYFYCRARTGVNAAKMMREPAFIEAMEICRWEGYSAVLAELLALAEFELRDAAGAQRDALTAALSQSYRRMLAGHPLPSHRGDWNDRIELADRQLGQVRMSEPHPAHELAERCGEVLFEHLPIHESLRVHDKDMIINQLRMGLMHHQEKLRARLRPAPVLAELLAPAG